MCLPEPGEAVGGGFATQRGRCGVPTSPLATGESAACRLRQSPCGEGACPPLGCAAALKPSTSVCLPEPGEAVGGGFATQRGRCGVPTSPLATEESAACRLRQSPCGEGACRNAVSPPLGCAAALKLGTSVCLPEPGEAVGAASPPSAGQARSPQKGHLPTDCRKPPVARGLFPRWAAQRPQTDHLGVSGRTL